MSDANARWQLEPPGAASRTLLFVLMVLLPVGITVGALLHAFAGGGAGEARLIAGSRTATFVVVTGLIAVMMTSAWWFMRRVIGRHRIALDADAIDVATTFYRRSLAFAELRLDEARVVDLAERTEFKPMLKTNGTGLPGLKSGWFRLRNRGKALVATAGGSRVLWLPTRNGYDLLLQPRSPQALLDELHRLAGRAPRR